MAKFGGLGRGLDALMGGASDVNKEAIQAIVNDSPVSLAKAETAVASSGVNIPEGVEVDEDGGLWVKPELLFANPNQPRKVFDQKELDELTASIKQHGVLEPIIVEKAENGKFCIITGERRYRASLAAGISKVPVLIRKFDEVRKFEVMLVENIQRTDLNPIDEANAYRYIMQLGELTQDEVAERVGKGRSTVANVIRLLNLPEDMQKALVEKKITAGHARALLSVTNMADQRVLFGKIIGSELSVHKAEEMARELNGGSRASSPKKMPKVQEKDPDIADIEQKFLEIFGTKVTLKGSLEKGSLVIDYFSKDDLDRLYNIIVK